MSKFGNWFNQNYAGNEGKTLSYDDGSGNKRDILMKLAQQAPQQAAPQAQIPEGMNMFNAGAANEGLKKDIANKMEVAQNTELNDPSGAIEDKKPNKAMVSAIGDVGESLAGPTKTIDMGSYSTFQPEDTMGNIKAQVLKNMMMRG